MCPQPLSKVVVNFVGIIEGGKLNERPQLAALVGQGISEWAEVEYSIANLLIVLLRAKARVGMSMYLALTSGTAQAAALRGAARESLTGKRAVLFSEVMHVLESVRKQRNKLAHGIWGVSPGMKDALLLFEPEDLVKHNLKILDSRRKGKLVPWDAMKVDRSKIMVYRASDFDRIIKDIKAVKWLVDRLTLYINVRSREMREELYPLLRDEPHMALARAQMSERKQKKTPQSPPPQRRGSSRSKDRDADGA